VQIGLEAVGRDEVVMRVRATPELDRDGARLADEALEALERVIRASGRPSAQAAARDGSAVEPAQSSAGGGGVPA
jgi:hypothetical protein